MVVLLTVVVIEFGSMAILAVEENAPNGNIKTASDALWFLVVTISTIGYGDLYPTTNLGRVIGTLILITGVALFTTLTGYLAHFFYGSSDHPLIDRYERRRVAERRRRGANGDLIQPRAARAQAPPHRYRLAVLPA